MLLHGPDPAQIATHRRDLIDALTEGDGLRLDRVEPETARRDPAALADALRARAFFPGRRAVLVDGARDTLADALAMALDGLRPDDAALVVTGPGLTVRSALVRLFDAPGRAVLAFYPDAGEDPGEALAAAGCTARPTPEAEAALAELAAELDTGSFRRFCDTLALYARGRDALGADDVAALAPTRPGGADALVAAVAGGEPGRVVPLVARLSGAGTTPQAMLSAATRHMRLIHRLHTEPGGPARAADALRPPVRGPRREHLLAEARGWNQARAERAIALLHEAERALRAPGARPERALAERALLRVAMLAGR